MTDQKPSERARRVAEQGRKIQSHIDEIDRVKSKSPKPNPKKTGAVQVGQREYPETLDETHLTKPGLEMELDTAPMFEGPEYKGSDKLKNMVALISGGDSGIGRAV